MATDILCLGSIERDLRAGMVEARDLIGENGLALASQLMHNEPSLRGEFGSPRQLAAYLIALRRGTKDIEQPEPPAGAAPPNTPTPLSPAMAAALEAAFAACRSPAAPARAQVTRPKPASHHAAAAPSRPKVGGRMTLNEWFALVGVRRPLRALAPRPGESLVSAAQREKDHVQHVTHFLGWCAYYGLAPAANGTSLSGLAASARARELSGDSITIDRSRAEAMLADYTIDADGNAGAAREALARNLLYATNYT